MAYFARMLSGVLTRDVVDKTDLPGKYEVNLTWTPDDASVDESQNDPVPSIYRAIREQLGLRLIPAKGPATMLIVNNAEKPSEN
jgi:uncharacterized protein (TIGR03435 family)